jgi:hypothetical protein
MVSEVESSWCVNFLTEAKQILSDALHLCNQANFSGVDACGSLVLLSEKIFMTGRIITSISLVALPCRNPAVWWLNHGGKMNQKFSTSLHQSFDVHRISDRRGKSGHRA